MSVPEGGRGTASTRMLHNAKAVSSFVKREEGVLISFEIVKRLL